MLVTTVLTQVLHVKHGATQSTAQCARKHLSARSSGCHARGLKDRVGVFVPRRSVRFTFTEGTYLGNPDMSSFSQTGLRFPFVFCDSQLILSWSVPMRPFTRAVVVTRWAENWGMLQM